MKTTTTLICFLIAFTSYSQMPDTYRKITNYLGDSSSSIERITGMAKLDTTYVLYITGHTDSTLWDLLIVETDRYGNSLNEYYQTNLDKEYRPYIGQTLLVDRDTNILVCSNRRHPDAEYDGYILKLTPDLDTVWSNTFAYTDTMNCQYPDPPVLRTYAIEQTPDGGYIIGFKYYIDCVPSKPTSRSGLLKLNAAGQEQWRKYYTDKNKLQSLHVTDSGNFVFNDWFNGYSVVKTDSLGNVLWNESPWSTGYLTTSEVAVNDDYIISVAPYIYNLPVTNPNDARFGVEISKMDLSGGHVIWNKRYRAFWSFDSGDIVQNFELRILDNEAIVLAGTSLGAYVDSVAYDTRGILFKFNSQGDSLWCRLYDHDRAKLSVTRFNDLVVANDGGFLAGGFFSDEYQYSSWLVKTDSMGMAPGVVYHDPGSYTKEWEKAEVNLYPNPTSGPVNISAGRHIKSLYVTDITGKILKRYDGVNTLKKTIDLSGLVNGVYILQIHTGEGVFSAKVIKE